MNPQPIVFIKSLETAGYAPVVEETLTRIGFFETVPAGGRVFLKPNLTFPTFRPGVMTSFDCLKAVSECLVARGFKVTIGEADSGGYNRFSMDEVFKGMGIYELAKGLGAEVVNLSFTDSEWLELRAGWRKLRVPFPRLLLREIDAFITLPVPKIHMNSLVSMSIKNQWGCIQEPSERLKLHPFLAEVMFEFERRLPRAFSIIDGRYGLNRTGPMLGDVIDLNFLLGSNDIVAADRVCCRIMQIDEDRVAYFRFFKEHGWWTSFDAIRLNDDPARFQREAFYLVRKWTDYPGLLCFHNSFLAWLGYHSPLAGFAHWLLYLFREPFYEYDKEKANVREETTGKG
jgi:uncharacterized protein (DUF362 family)